MHQGREMDASYFMVGKLMPGSNMKICVWCGCPLNSLRVCVVCLVGIFKEHIALHLVLYFQSIAVIDLIAALSTQHLG